MLCIYIRLTSLSYTALPLRDAARDLRDDLRDTSDCPAALEAPSTLHVSDSRKHSDPRADTSPTTSVAASTPCATDDKLEASVKHRSKRCSSARESLSSVSSA